MESAAREEPRGILSGLRVVDLAEPWGAYVSRILGDFGAEVIKVEPPQGDPGRHLAPFARAGEACMSLPFIHANVNKYSIVLDLDTPAAQDNFLTLLQQADVIVSTAPAETWAQRGLVLQDLHRRFPRLVWTALTPFGLTGPYHPFAGNNIVVEAMGGLMYIQGDDAFPPCVSPYEQGAHLASLHAIYATLAALWERRRSGYGQLVEVSMQEVVAHVYYAVVRYAYSREILRRPGGANPQPANGYYPCQDGQVFLSIFQPNHWDRLVEVAQEPGLANAAFRDRFYRDAHSAEVDPYIQRFAARFAQWDLTEQLQKRGLPVAPVCTIADLAANVHLAARQFFTEHDQPPLGTLRGPGPLYRSTAMPLQWRRPAPQVGEHQALLHSLLAEPSTPAVAASSGQRQLPLQGVRVLDLSRVWAGPYGTRYLADLGAEVIKVESSQFPEGRRPGDPTFTEINRNKRCITLNFQIPAGRELLKRLVAVSDVVVENFSPRVMVQYELDYPHLCAVRPDVIMASMPGFGKSGPHSAFVSYGGPLMAYTGMALLWGHPQSPIAAHSKIAYPDYIAAGTLAVAVLAALHHRAHTGEGQFIEIAQVEATATAMEVAFLDYFANGTVATPQGNRHATYAPQGCYPCLGHDAWCVVSCTTETQWRALARLIGGEALADDPQFATPAARQQRHNALDDLIAAWTRQRTPHQAMHLFQAAGVPAGAVQSGEDLWRDAHLRERGTIFMLDHPDYGPVDHTAALVRLHESPAPAYTPIEQLGESNTVLFRELLGMSREEMAHLLSIGAIG